MATHAAFEPLQALYRVFVAPSLMSRSVRPSVQYSGRFSQACLAQHNRNYAVYRGKARKVDAEIRREKWNYEIKADMVALVDPVTAKLQPPTRLRDLLRGLDLDTHRLVQLSPDEPNNPDFIPVCRLVEKRELYNAAKRRKEQNKEATKARAAQMSIKTLEMNWAIDANDLQHRLNRMKEFLEDGRKVEVILAAKKRGRKATPEECEQVMRTIRLTVDEVTGAREAKAMEGKIGSVAMLFFQGTPLTNGPSASQDKALEASNEIVQV